MSARFLHKAQALADSLDRRRCWIVAASIAGAAPLAVAFALGWPGNHLVSAALLVPLLVAAVSRDSTANGLTALAVAFLAHNALAIALTAGDPVGMARLFPAGDAYWIESREWIVTGRSPEYVLAHWVPAHFQLLAGSSFFSYTSLGLITLSQGMHEVDLMNVYVGRLLAESDAAGPGLALAWHPWSICRGCGYLLLTFEVVSLSFARLTSTRLSTARRRAVRWSVGLMFLGADAVLKFFLLEPVRLILAAHLTPGE